MKTLPFLIIIVGFNLSSCCKASFENNFVIRNESNHTVELKRMSGGVEVLSLTVAPSSSIIRNGLEQITEDSTVITFDKTISVTHYSPILMVRGKSLKSIQPENPRSIYNSEKFEVVKKDLSCGGNSTVSTFSITEQDYSNAAH